MNAIPIPPARRHRLNAEEYHRMGEAGILRAGQRVELIEGEIVDMVPIGSQHAAAVARLIELLGDARSHGALLQVQNPLRLGDHSEPEPDLMILRRRPDFYASGHPRAEDVLLLIEVADSSAGFDREVKLPLYARHGVPEVWLIDLRERRVEAFSEPREGKYLVERQIGSGVISPVSVPLPVTMEQLFG